MFLNEYLQIFHNNPPESNVVLWLDVDLIALFRPAMYYVQGSAK